MRSGDEHDQETDRDREPVRLRRERLPRGASASDGVDDYRVGEAIGAPSVDRHIGMVKRSKRTSLSRREFLRLALLTGAGLLAGCTRRVPPPAPLPPATLTCLTPPPPPPPRAPSPPTSPPAPADLIKNIVIFIQENPTFDSLFAGFPAADGE